MRPDEYITAARVPESIPAQEFGPWRIERLSLEDSQFNAKYVGFKTLTLLRRTTLATLHLEHGEVVMDDSQLELRRHLAIWISARGRVLITGLGLGCVARGLLAKPEIRQLTIVELDRGILDRIGPEFERDPRARLIHGDALKISLPGEKFDYAWHDIWTEGPRSLHLLHAELMARFRDQAEHQGAWQFPRLAKRMLPARYLR